MQKALTCCKLILIFKPILLNIYGYGNLLSRFSGLENDYIGKNDIGLEYDTRRLDALSQCLMAEGLLKDTHGTVSRH